MLTIDNLDDREDIKNVVVKGLKVRQPESLACSFVLDAEDPDNYKISVSVGDDVNEEFDVVFDDALPGGYIPKFLINAKVFNEPGRIMNIIGTYEWALAMAVMASTEVKVKFQREKNDVVVVLSIGAFITEKRLPLEAVKSIFEPVKK